MSNSKITEFFCGKIRGTKDEQRRRQLAPSSPRNDPTSHSPRSPNFFAIFQIATDADVASLSFGGIHTLESAKGQQVMYLYLSFATVNTTESSLPAILVVTENCSFWVMTFPDIRCGVERNTISVYVASQQWIDQGGWMMGVSFEVGGPSRCWTY